MADIYQEIWEADQAGNGIKPVLGAAAVNEAQGFVRVNTADGDGQPDYRLLPAHHIPAHKQSTYTLVTRLFDNYVLDERAGDPELPEEREEVHDLLQAITDTPPMQVARAYVERATGTQVSIERWYSTLLEMWFRRFRLGGDLELTGFEHVVVGEQEGGKCQGYHFWYKYLLDDGLVQHQPSARATFPAMRDDRIVYLRSKATGGQAQFPETVTISYLWHAPDYEQKALRPLTKPTGGFFVGCSVEGLLALGTVRAHLGARAPKEAVINGARYSMAIARSADDKHVRTFFPKFLGSAGQVPTGSETPPGPTIPEPAGGQASIRIVAALINPFGGDPGSETVILMNMRAEPVPLEGWTLIDKMNNRYQIPATMLGGGAATTILLPNNSMQLSNKGGEIRLVDRDGRLVHRVSYSKAQASIEGQTVLF